MAKTIPTKNSGVGMMKTAGFWLAAIMGIMQALNAVRALIDPVAFSAYMGLPLEDSADVGFVLVYGLRTAFIAILIGVFLLLKRLDALAWMALVALLLPIGDAWLATQSGASAAIIARHVAIAVYLLIAFVFLRRAAHRIA